MMPRLTRSDAGTSVAAVRSAHLVLVAVAIDPAPARLVTLDVGGKVEQHRVKGSSQAY